MGSNNTSNKKLEENKEISNNTSNKKTEEIKETNSNTSNIFLNNIKSKFILKKIFDNLKRNRQLKIVKYNKKLQIRLNISIQEYKNYSETCTPIEIELIPN